MATTYAPDHWEEGSGTVWGTDVDEETSVVESGGSSLIFKSASADAASMVYDDFIPIVPSKNYYAGIRCRTADNTAGNNIGVQVDWYTSAQASISGSNLQDELPATGTWYTLGNIIESPSNAAFAKVKIHRAASGFNAYIDQVVFHATESYWSGQRITSAQSIPTGTWTTIAYNYFDDYGVVGNASTGVVTITDGGVVAMSAVTELENYTAGDIIQTRFKVVDTIAFATGYTYGSTLRIQDTGIHRLTSTYVNFIRSQATVEFQIYHDAAGAENVSVDKTTFQGRVSPAMF